MRNAIVIFTGLLIVVSSLSAYAGNANKLYKGHEFGMSKAEIMKTPNVYDCAEIVEKDALCLDELTNIHSSVELTKTEINGEQTARLQTFYKETDLPTNLRVIDAWTLITEHHIVLIEYSSWLGRVFHLQLISDSDNELIFTTCGWG